MVGGQEMTYGRSIPGDLRLAEEAGMVFPEVVVEEAEAEVDELETLKTAQLRAEARPKRRLADDNSGSGAAGGGGRTGGRRTRWKTQKLYERRTSVTRRRTLQVQ
jgi:hypothetical protein